MSEIQWRILAVVVALFFSINGVVFLLRRQWFGLPLLSGSLLGLALLGVVPCLAMPAPALPSLFRPPRYDEVTRPTKPRRSGGRA